MARFSRHFFCPVSGLAGRVMWPTGRQGRYAGAGGVRRFVTDVAMSGRSGCAGDEGFRDMAVQDGRAVTVL